MLVVSLAVPLCVQALSDGNADLSKRRAVEVAEEISRNARELSLRPVGESRILSFGDYLTAMGPGMTITAGCLLGEGGFTVIRCEDGKGWARSVPVDLSPEVKGFCSAESAPLVIDCKSGDLVISHGLHTMGEVIRIGEL